MRSESADESEVDDDSLPYEPTRAPLLTRLAEDPRREDPWSDASENSGLGWSSSDGNGWVYWA